MKLKRTTESFIKEYNDKFGDKYDFSKFEYNGIKTPSTAICRKHGEFVITPKRLLEGHGCKECSKEEMIAKKTMTQEEFIKRVKEIHGDKYDLSKAIYKGIFEKVELICPKHGSFWIRPHNIINGKQGCRKCGYEKNADNNRLTKEEFIRRARNVHGDKYDYSLVEYNGGKTIIPILCHNIDNITGKEHGIFYQRASDHLCGCGCSKCSNKFNYTVEEYIEKAKIIHNNKYDYSKLPEKFENYSTEKICVICPEHGEFWVKPNVHLYGVGCPVCNKSHLETVVTQLLIENNIKYIYQKQFDWLKRDDKRLNQSLDFYLPEYNIAIECQGRQHFEPIDFFGGIEEYKDIVDRDKNKLNKCNEHGIKILYYTNLEYPTYPYDICTDKSTLLSKIKRL